MHSRSTPIPNANPCHARGSSPQLASTRGCTIPEPSTSSQSPPLPISPVRRSQPMSISIDGSVNGKYDARNRTGSDGWAKNARRNSITVPLRCPSVIASAPEAGPITSPSHWWNIGECVASWSAR